MFCIFLEFVSESSGRPLGGLDMSREGQSLECRRPAQLWVTTAGAKSGMPKARSPVRVRTAAVALEPVIWLYIDIRRPLVGHQAEERVFPEETKRLQLAA